MGISNGQTQEKEVKQNKSYDLMYYWKYSDGAYGSVLYNTETAAIEHFREYRNKGVLLLAKNKYERIGLETTELCFSSGITKENGRLTKETILLDGVKLRATTSPTSTATPCTENEKDKSRQLDLPH